MNIDHWLVPLPLNDEQQTDLSTCQNKLQSLLNLPIRIDCLPSETLWNNTNDQTNLSINHRNPLKMYWQRNLNELRLFLKPRRDDKQKLEANIVEIHQRRRLPFHRYVKQNLLHSSVMISYLSNMNQHYHSLLLTITGKHCLLEFQIPSTDVSGLVYRGTYRKMGEDAQSRPVSALFNCTIHLDDDMALLLSEYGLCRLV